MADGRSSSGRQTTLRRPATVSGVGVHSGRAVSLTLHPAEEGSGIWFCRTDSDGTHDNEVLASFQNVSATDFCTAVGMNGATVATVEHLMAALSALGVDNATIEIDGPEVPVMDGAASAFVAAVEQAGIATLEAPRKYIKVLKPVSVRLGESHAEFRPHDRMRIEVEIDFANALIGRQSFAADVDAAVFRREIARARTFGFLADVEKLWERGLALGASLDNSVVIGDDRIINPEGLRYPDEFVRHKALDAVGDLALAGAPILGLYRSYRGGHGLNLAAVKALIADESAWTFVEAHPEPRREAAGAVPAGAVAAFSPDT